MATSEMNCSWHFAQQIGGREDGPNDAMSQNFKKYPYASLIRESIQNSLDAVADKSKPVVVTFTDRTIKSRNFPNFFELKEHIQGCIEYFNNNKTAKDVYGKMLDNFKNDLFSDIHYIQISDSNTKGMRYVHNDTNCEFYAFLMSAGVSSKENDNAGGSFGFGKAAYFLLSPIATVLVSTKTESGACFFEGAAMLCTHLHNGNKVVSVGYYDNNNGLPCSDVQKIPERFRRYEAGTDVNVMGISIDDDSKTEMVESVLRNFWLAIFDHKLEVQIGESTLINSDTLDSIMNMHFPTTVDDYKNINHYNPRPYFDAVRYANTNNKYICVEGCLTETSVIPVKLYLNKDKNARDRIIYMRKPKMVVFRKRNQSSYGVYGFFICDSDIGNKMLRDLENPAHDEWRGSNSKNPLNRKLLDGIQQFITNSLNKLFEANAAESLQITGLEKYLYVPESLINDGSDYFDEENPFGVKTGDTVDDGNSLTTSISNEAKVSSTATEVGTIRVVSTGEITPEGSILSTANIGHHKNHVKSKGGEIGPGREKKNVKIDDSDKKHQIELDVTFRVIAYRHDSLLYHRIIVHCPSDVEDGEVVILVAGEERNDVINISSSDLGNIRGNIISNLHLNVGSNVINVRFSDNIQHSIILSAYEYK